jgi:hypothetical protein
MKFPMGSGGLGHRPGARRASGASLKIAEKVAVAACRKASSASDIAASSGPGPPIIGAERAQVAARAPDRPEG